MKGQGPPVSRRAAATHVEIRAVSGRPFPDDLGQFEAFGASFKHDPSQHGQQMTNMSFGTPEQWQG